MGDPLHDRVAAATIATLPVASIIDRARDILRRVS